MLMMPFLPPQGTPQAPGLTSMNGGGYQAPPGLAPDPSLTRTSGPGLRPLGAGPADGSMARENANPNARFMRPNGVMRRGEGTYRKPRDRRPPVSVSMPGSAGGFGGLPPLGSPIPPQMMQMLQQLLSGGGGG